MRKLFVPLFVVLCTALAARADITINLTAGQLQTSGSSPMLDGRLIQLVVDTGSNGFTMPTGSSFTGGSSDDKIAASFLMDSSSTGFAGDVTISLPLSLGVFLGWNATDPLLLRWWPTISGTTASSPGMGVSFGQFRTDSVVDGSSIGWFTPTDNGQTYTLNFLTVSEMGSQPNSFGVASFLTPVPEPSSIAALAAGAALLTVFARGRKKR